MRACRRLVKQQELWARYYIVDFNATQAAIDAGYAKSGAATRGYELSHNALVLTYVAQLVDRRNKRIDVDADYVCQRLAEIDQLDVADILNDQGEIMAIHLWPKAWRTLISGIDISEIWEGRGSERIQTGLLKKIKWPDKLKNLELLGKHVDVRAWEKEAHRDDEVAPPLQITFTVAEAKADMKVTNAKP